MRKVTNTEGTGNGVTDVINMAKYMVLGPLELVCVRNVERLGTLGTKSPKLLIAELNEPFWWVLERPEYLEKNDQWRPGS